MKPRRFFRVENVLEKELPRLVVRWTIGDVSLHGFEALRLSLWGARRIFGNQAAYVVFVNSIPLSVARARAGEIPGGIHWLGSTEVPPRLAQYLDCGMAEGTGWKFAPPQVFFEGYELALDNDCILWEIPSAIQKWLDAPHTMSCVLAEDVKACFGQFTELCGPAPRNTGIRGFPPGFDLEEALCEVLQRHPVRLVSELDEQGLQVAAMSQQASPFIVTVDEVTICSPFPPHLPHLGRCGAHFVGLNAKQLPWNLHGRPASMYVEENWLRLREAVCAKIGIPEAKPFSRK